MPPVEAVMEENRSLKEENAALRTQLAWLKKQIFGGGKSEKLDSAQLQLQLETLERLEREVARTETVTFERKAGSSSRQVPAEQFKDLPVKETLEIIPEEVKAQPEMFERIGQEETFEVDIDPPRLFKRRIIRPKYRHRLDRSRPPVVAPAPARLIQGGYASAGLMAWVALAKYADHLPLHRQEKMFERWGAKIPRQTMADWIALVARELEPIYKLMLRQLKDGGYVQVDETPIRCHDPDAKRGKTEQGWMWVMSRPGGNVVFSWRLSRRHEELKTLLPGYHGTLQSDGYQAYASLAGKESGIDHAGCWAHARRPFLEALKASPVAATFVLRLIGHLYRYEREWKQMGPTLRATHRGSHFGMTLSLLKRTVTHLARRSLPKSELGKACHYLLNQWEPLAAHCRLGHTEIDNNGIENAIRPSAVGKKNWLFIGHPDAGNRSAILYSIIVSCQRHGLNAQDYLRDVLYRLPAMTNQEQMEQLLPERWQPSPSVSEYDTD
jgi:transposase